MMVRTEEELRRKYREFLIKQVWKERTPFPYETLFAVLAKTEFYTLVFRDENREADARTLRKTFTDRQKQDCSCLEGPVSLLEVMVALAMRMDGEICSTPRDGYRADKWFWMMIRNMDLLDQKDTSPDLNIDKCVRNAKMVVERTYKDDGEGSLFGVMLTPNTPSLEPDLVEMLKKRFSNTPFGVQKQDFGVQKPSKNPKKPQFGVQKQDFGVQKQDFGVQFSARGVEIWYQMLW